MEETHRRDLMSICLYEIESFQAILFHLFIIEKWD